MGIVASVEDRANMRGGGDYGGTPNFSTLSYRRGFSQCKVRAPDFARDRVYGDSTNGAMTGEVALQPSRDGGGRAS